MDNDIKQAFQIQPQQIAGHVTGIHAALNGLANEMKASRIAA